MEHRILLSYFWVLLIFNCCHICLQQPTRADKNERRIVFPTSNETGHSLPVFPDHVAAYVGGNKPLAPPVDDFGRPLCVKRPDDTFCEDIDNYPENEIRKSINYSSDEFVELFGTMSISSRKSLDMDEDPICLQRARSFYPKAAMNENEQWAYVVNDVDYVQTVRAEVCDTDVNQPCKYLDGVMPYGFSSRCRQKFAYKRLLALHPNKKRTYTDEFRFPSCCVCFVKKYYMYKSSGAEDQTSAEVHKIDNLRIHNAKPATELGDEDNL